MPTQRCDAGEPTGQAAAASRDPRKTGAPDPAAPPSGVASGEQREPALAGPESTPHPQGFGSDSDAPERQALDQRAQRAYARIAEDPAITGDLTDAPARQLLAWARDEVRRLVAETRALDEPAAWKCLDPKIAYLRRHLRRIARDAASQPDVQAALQTSLVSPDYPAS